MKVVVIGAVAGGPSFATRLRRINEQAEIVMLERGPEISYAGCALPYYLGGVINDRDALIERTPEALRIKNNIDVRVQSEVTAIDPDAQLVTVQTDTETYQESYDELVIATGARPTLPAIPGLAEADDCFTLRTVTDADKIKAYMDQKHSQRVAIIGAGVAGLELADNLTLRGMKVTLIEQSAHVAFPYDPEIATVIEKELTDHHVALRLNKTVTDVRNHGHQLIMSDGTQLTTDMLLVTTGVTPNNEVAAAAGIKLATNGHIIVNNRLATNLPHVYAIGDVIETTSLITGLPTPSMLSTAANRQGHILADIINGEPLTYAGFVGTSVAKVFDLTVSSVGFTANTLKHLGIDSYDSAFITPYDIAYFFPNASRINFKLIYAPNTGRILGGQAVGQHGVDKRIGQLSAAITGGLTVADLPDIEVPYSPPFSSTRDVINIAGYVALNQMQQVGQTIKLDQLTDEMKEKGVFLDVREPGRPATGSVSATLTIPLSQLRDRIHEIPVGKPVFLTYRPGLSNYTAARILAGNDIEAKIIEEID
ncbi:FAD-dependent oxidoreductase [Furfurilactobacillus milii]|uniref:FAD-dependent oxidoreductase n=1 Tax=Furfurilactobacillus milii TaxID=2888272 RepID=A0ABT6DCW7_9LACO|nr:FAD-dependent oxidoreductase [Furfurilactobacillus milii]QLE65873.1 FAD-dependent pyridine nucleotide-disulfide oxidoreductase [Furfurilactobacillus rossiae]MCF6160219.1 FAD-dependent oxidoreductase [Furfurilactobacillus milii]MCF6162162.1 FAD-dependent oxidoreductase [Furfurilactobacillus milii]MDF9913181.1 FAD-dependent oxidoreductase [Furfurilactobacillus milii]QLE68303.1 FAD-dependent pyridine nucleotide-disulfide oxidoreductase [Furfurilactobacillus rossiae]